MPVVAAIAGIVSIGLTVGGMASRKNAANKSQDAAVEIGEENARVLERQAEQGERVMGYQLGQFDKNAGRFVGSQEAAISSSGVTRSGSAAMVARDTTGNLRTDRRNLYDTYQNKITELRNQANLTRKTANLQGEVMQANANADLWNMGADVASGIGNVATSGADAGWWGN